MLIVASVAILGALGVVRVAAYFVVDQELKLATETARMADISNRQRNLGQTAVRLAYEDGSDKQELAATLSELGRLQKTLSDSEVADAGTQRSLDGLDMAVTHIQVAGREILRQPRGANIRGPRYEILHYQKQLEASMREVQETLTRQADERLANSQRTHKWMLVTGLLFLAIAIGLVAWPLRNRLKGTLNELEESHRIANERADELDILRLELEKANGEMKERHVMLRQAYDESASTNQFLMMASARFEDLFHGVPFACFSVDAAGMIFEWNEAATQMFGISGHEIIQQSVYGRFLSLDNDFLLKGLVAEAFKGHHMNNVEIVANCPSGPRHLLVSVFPLKASRQEPTAALIACADITLQKDAEQRATRANEKVVAILDSIKDAFVTLDRGLHYRYVNNTAAEWLGLSPAQIIGRSLTDITPRLHGSDFIKRIERLMEVGEGECFEHYFEEAKVWLEFRVYPSEDGVSIFYNDITVRKADEETIKLQREQLELTMLKLNENSVLLSQQQLELEEANRNLQELATTDGLTGLRNHRAMQDELIVSVRRSKEKKAAVSVALLDVDHFKKFNDSFGHQAGDVVLREVARILSASVRDGDIVARYGGEEFCVILPETPEEEALIVCERIRASVERAPWEQRQVTISIGLSSATNVQETQEFIKQADQALYEAKAAGRNCVRVYRAENYRCA
jgi:diguanylate cyclase (GGDEF)-like protein/PAS domain S-box-containing protein